MVGKISEQFTVEDRDVLLFIRVTRNRRFCDLETK